MLTYLRMENTRTTSQTKTCAAHRPQLTVILGLTLALTVAVLCLAASLAHALTATLISEVPSTVDDGKTIPFKVSVEAHAEGDNIIYSISNNGADWPRFTLVGVYYQNGMGVVINRRIKLKAGETYTLQGQRDTRMPGVLEFRINAAWINQDFVIRGLPTEKPKVVEQAEHTNTVSVR